ncbi:PEP-CTERM/exosortase system-associated acyltransferase [Uliginosibacterium sp. sgz301328]|uniref:PEP-CTERM/exosortase system-associated acyltransferase n=1 Tax=Uliginosibacterium sp. sgz301328 TaxID=3243764 RepID=UPI00359EAD03
MLPENSPQGTRLGDGFASRFEIVPALAERTRDEVYFIRHDVYCRELGFEPTRPDCRECDQYDRQAVHCLMRTTADTGHRLVGCARVVLTSPEDRDRPLPFELACRNTLWRGNTIDPARLPRDRIAEVSRLAIMHEFRRRRGEEARDVSIKASDFGSTSHPRFPFIPVGLYLAAVSMAARCGVEYIFTLTEPRLAQHFGRLGVNIAPIGGPVEHRGIRIPSVMHVPEIIQQIRPSIQPMWQAVTRQIDMGYRQYQDETRVGQTG